RLEASAKGYLPEEQNLKIATIRQIEPGHWFERTSSRPANLVVELYSKPAFSIELVVPAWYRGLIKAELQTSENVPCPVGQRCFRYEVPPSGDVQINGPVQLLKGLGPEYHAVFADGRRLDEKMDPVKVGFLRLKTEGSCECFVAGTQADFEQFCFSGGQ